MNKLFRFQKKETSPIENKEAKLEQIRFPYSVDGRIAVEEEIQSGYEDQRWIEKSNKIKARDNYTCQLCGAFNPMIGHVVIQQGEYETLHMLEYNEYHIHVIGYNLTITFDFYDNFHLAMPRLNVHHKVYFRNRYLWNYPDECLVTLCENCHHYVHSLKEIGIPIMEENDIGEQKLLGITQPKSYIYKLNHTDLGTFHPLALVKENRWGSGLNGSDLAEYKKAKVENKRWYDYYNIIDNNVVHISYFYIGDPRFNTHTKEESEVVSKFIIKDFIENILGFAKIDT